MNADATLYEWWRNACAGNLGPIHDNEPQCGFYRKRKFKDGPWQPVAIFPDPDTGEITALVDNRHIADAGEIWTWVAKHPVEHEVYEAVIRGEPWPGTDETVEAQVAGIGHNSGADDVETLRDQIASAKAGAAAYGKIADDETLAKAQSLRSRLLELKGEAEKKHRAEKAPFLEAGRQVDQKWFPLRDDAKGAADAIRSAMSAWETEKLRREREAQRKAEEARRAAETAQEGENAAPAPEQPAPAPKASAPIRGAYGRAATTKLVKVATVADQDAAYGYLKERPELRDLIAKLAQRAVDAGHDVPGVDVEEARKVA